MKVYPVFLRYVHDRQDVLQKIFSNEKQAIEYCKIPEGERPSGLCYLRYEEWEVITNEN